MPRCPVTSIFLLLYTARFTLPLNMNNAENFEEELIVRPNNTSQTSAVDVNSCATLSTWSHVSFFFFCLPFEEPIFFHVEGCWYIFERHLDSFLTNTKVKLSISVTPIIAILEFNIRCRWLLIAFVCKARFVEWTMMSLRDTHGALVFFLFVGSRFQLN